MILRRLSLLAGLLAVLACWPLSLLAQININDADAVNENFNAMAGTTTLPANWKISRVIATTTSGSTASGATVVNVASTANLLVGMVANATGGAIPAGTTITVVGASNVTLSAATTASMTSGTALAFTNGNNPDYNASINLTSVGAATTTGSATGNSYNYGQSTNERAVGFQSSPSYPTPQSIMARYRNNTGSTLADMTVSFDIERYRINSTAASTSFFYSTNGSTWIAVASGDVASSQFATASSSFTFATPTVVSRTAAITGINLANGADVYFRWGFNLSNANSQGLGLDNVSVVGGSVSACTTPTAQPTNLVFSAGTATSISGSFTAATGSPSGYLVVRYPAASTPTNPTDGVQYAVNNSLGSGTVIGVTTGTSFSTTGLVASNSYDVYVYAFNNSACTGGPKFNTSAPLQGQITPCGSITAPTTLNFSNVGTGSISGTISGISGSPAGYLVVRYDNGATVTPPTDGVLYTANTSLGTGTIVSTNALTTFTALNLNISTTYDFYVYAIANLNCLGGPVYSATPLLASQSTTGCPSFSSTITINPAASQVDGSVYTSLTSALSQLSGCAITQPTVIELASNYTSAGETFPINLPAISGASATNTLTIRPASGSSNLLITSATVGNPTLQINGGTHWIVDGRIGGTGSTINLIIENTDNTTAGSSAIRFINGAQNSRVSYCEVRSSNIGVASGCISFGVSTTVGNSNNTVSFCKIHESSAGTPNVGIGSVASLGFDNDNNQILNNEIYNTFTPSGNSYGVYISDNNTNWTISGNSFYQTASRVQTSGSDRNFAPIASSPTTASSVTGLVISGNFIGGTAPQCGGTPLTLSDNGTGTIVLRGIFLQVGTAVPTSVQGNTIANISITSSSNSFNHTGIGAVTGSIDIGTVTGNTIGSMTGTGSISLTQTTSVTVGRLNGIIAGVGTPGTINIANNQIGGLSVSNSSTGSVSLAGIHLNNTAYTITNNTIGGVANSLQNNTANDTWGIIMPSSTTGSTVTGNTIKNLSGNTGRTIGIRADGGNNTISGNTILGISGNSTQADGVSGIVSASTAAGQTIAGNTIHSLTNGSFTASPAVNGIYYTGPTSGTNVIERNFVHSLNLASTSTSASMFGIRVLAAAIPVAIQNNMVRLGILADGSSHNNGNMINGIFNGSTATTSTNFNTIYIGGSTSSGATGSTYALQSTSTSNNRQFVNNILVNARSGGSSGSHYTVGVGGTGVNPTGLTLDHNIYRSTGTNSFTARYNGSNYLGIAALQSTIGQDANSLFCDPALVNPTGNATLVDLHILASAATAAEGTGTVIADVTTDFDGQTRSTLSPTDIGADAGNFIALTGGCELVWTGNEDTNWNNANNWTGGIETPSFSSNVVVTGVPSNQPALSANSATNHLRISAGAEVSIPSSITLSVFGNISASNTASIAGDGKVSMLGNTVTGTLNVTNLDILNTGGTTVPALSRINIVPNASGSGVLSIASSASLINNGIVVLRSNDNGTASLGTMLPGAAIVGNITVEHQYPATPGWYFVGSPIKNATLQSWNQMVPVVNPKNLSNIREYTEGDQTVLNINGRIIEENGWKVPSALTNVVNPGDEPSGYRFYLNSIFMGAHNRTMSVTGTPFTGLVSKNLTFTPAGFGGGGWNLVANPYPSAIDWNAMRFDVANNSADLSAAVHIWNGVARNYGTWTALSAGTGTGVGISSSLIASGQAFFVKASAARTLIYRESFKSRVGANVMRGAALDNELKFKLTQGHNWDEAAVLFYPDANHMHDQFDAQNLPSAVDISSSYVPGTNLAINVMGELQNPVQIPVNIAATEGPASISFNGISSFDASTTITLVDNFTGLRHDLRSNPEVNFNITAASASQGNGRFTLVFSPAVTSLNPVKPAAKLSVWPNPSAGVVNVAVAGFEAGVATAEVLDNLGRSISRKTMSIAETNTDSLVLDNLPAGVYQIKVNNETRVMTQQVVVR